MLKVTLSVRPTKQNIKVFSMFLISIFCSFIQRQKFCVFKPYLLDIVFVRISTKTWKTIIISANDEHLHEKDFFVLHIFGQFSSQIIYIAFSLYNSRPIVKLLAKAKLKSWPYNHTDHPPTHQPTRNFKSSLNKSIQVLHQHMIHFWNP